MRTEKYRGIIQKFAGGDCKEKLLGSEKAEARKENCRENEIFSDYTDCSLNKKPVNDGFKGKKRFKKIKHIPEFLMKFYHNAKPSKRLKSPQEDLSSARPKTQGALQNPENRASSCKRLVETKSRKALGSMDFTVKRFESGILSKPIQKTRKNSKKNKLRSKTPSLASCKCLM